MLVMLVRSEKSEQMETQLGLLMLVLPILLMID